MFDVNETVRMFAEQYYEKIFYFSLKKTGSQTEAEDLTSEIAIDIISALRKGVIPEYFSAYVWKCARSRYAKWAEKRAKFRDNFDGGEINEDFKQEYNLEDNYILSEDLKSLRRELALISKDYREILVSFYIDDKKISQIAREFNLPEGTIKTKLFKSRKILMEGMKMAREFGIRSYKPENVQFTKSGMDGTDGSPWSKLERKLAKNILLEAYYNPSTIEELSLELGVAAPYMEEEVDTLVAAEMLKKLDGGKYETDFMILNAEAQREIENAHLRTISESFMLQKQLINIIFEEAEKDGRKLLGGYQTFEDLKWLYLLRIIDNLGSAAYGEKYSALRPKSYTERPHGGYWELLGYEEFAKNPENFFVSKNGSEYGGVSFDIYDFSFKDLEQRWLKYVWEQKTLQVISDMFKGKADEEKDRETIDFLVNNGAFELKGGKYIPKFAVLDGKQSVVTQSVSEDVYKSKIEPVYNKLKDLHIKLFDEIDAVIKKNIPARLEDKLWFYAETYMSLRGYIISAALKDGYIKIPEDFGKSMVGAALYLKQ